MLKFGLWRDHSRFDRVVHGLSDIFAGLVTVLSFGTFYCQNFEVTCWMAKRTMEKEQKEKDVFVS